MTVKYRTDATGTITENEETGFPSNIVPSIFLQNCSFYFDSGFVDGVIV
jgi:hypothetical protein